MALAQLDQLRRTLDGIRARRGEQQRIVEELQAPLKRLQEMEAAEQAALDALAAAEAEVEQKQAELADVRQWLAWIEPLEADMHAAIRALDKLNALAERNVMTNISQHDTYRVSYQCSMTLELLEQKRAERERLEAELKRLGAR